MPNQKVGNQIHICCFFQVIFSCYCELTRTYVDSLDKRDAEFQLLENGWIQCTQQLCQFDVCAKLTEEHKNPDLLLATVSDHILVTSSFNLSQAWKLRHWKKYKDALLRLELQRDPSAIIRLSQLYSTLLGADEFGRQRHFNILTNLLTSLVQLLYYRSYSWRASDWRWLSGGSCLRLCRPPTPRPSLYVQELDEAK